MTLTTQFYTMLAMISMGSFFGASLDTYSRFLKRSVRKRWIVFVNDILFWIIQGLLIFYILFLVNFGEIRFYIFVALACGFAAYQALMKNTYLKLLEIIIQAVVASFEFLYNTLNVLIYSPLKWVVLTLVTLTAGSIKGVLSLVKMLLKVLLLVVKILFKPINWILSLLFRLIPTNIKKKLEKYYQILAGFVKKTTNKFMQGIKFMNRKFNRK